MGGIRRQGKYGTPKPPYKKKRKSSKNKNDNSTDQQQIPRPMSSPITTDGAYTDDQVEFMKAMDKYRTTRRRRFPTCCEVLAVLRSLGYRKVEEATDLPTYEIRGCIIHKTIVKD